MMDRAGKAWFLEINTIPGMTATSLSPMAAGAVGMSFAQLVERLLLAARCHCSAAAAHSPRRPARRRFACRHFR